MEKIKYSIWKHGLVVFIVTTIIFNLYYLLDSENDLNRIFMRDNLTELVVGVLVVFALVYLQNCLKSGLYFSQDKIIIKKNGKIISSSWQDVKIEKETYGIAYVLVFHFTQSGYTYKHTIFYGNSDSFKRLSKKYAPEKHQILSF